MSLAHAILGLLNYQPMSGYDFNKAMEQSIAHFWTATQSHIYKELNSLELEHFVEATEVHQTSKPNRKEYSITVKGQAELRNWLVNPLPLNPIREAWLTQLFFSHELSDEEVLELLRARRREIQKQVDDLELAKKNIEGRTSQKAVEMKRVAKAWRLTLDYGDSFYNSELAWLDRIIEEIVNA